MAKYASLGESIQAFLRKYGLEEEVRIQRILTDWEAFVGKPIAQATEKIWYENGTLFIQMSSPAWRNELSMARLRLIQHLNKEIGQALIQDIQIR